MGVPEAYGERGKGVRIGGYAGILRQQQQRCGRKARRWGQQKRCGMMRDTEDKYGIIYAGRLGRH